MEDLEAQLEVKSLEVDKLKSRIKKVSYPLPLTTFFLFFSIDGRK